MERRILTLDGRDYRVEVRQQLALRPNIPRLIIPAYLPNVNAVKLLKTCLSSIRTQLPPESYELWVVDNCSPREHCAWLLEERWLNLVLSKTKPLPPERRGLLERAAFWISQKNWGSYANAVGLELGTRMIDPDTKYLVTLHMDTMVCSKNWLTALLSKISASTPAVGVCKEKVRHPEGVLHVLCYLVDFQLFKEFNIDFFPDLPKIDVGDKTSLVFRDAGYELFSFNNTYEYPEITSNIHGSEEMKRFQVMRVVDEEYEVIFMHLGRGVRKSDASYVGVSAALNEWVSFAETHILHRSGNR